VLVAVEGLDGHEVGERVVVVVVARNERGSERVAQHARRVNALEEGVVQDAACGALLYTNAPVR
jgi:hypothetical protein